MSNWMPFPLIGAASTLLLIASTAFSGTETSGTSAQWKSLCADHSVSCSHIRTEQGMETYYVCAKGKCYAVLCNEGSPNAVCLKDEQPDKRPPPKKFQAGIFGLL